MISLSRQFAFVHVYKTGGTSLSAALHRLADRPTPDGTHATAAELKAYLGEHLWAEWFTFAVIRHPLDRLVSGFRYRQQYKAPHNEEYIAPDVEFSDWVLGPRSDYDYRYDWAPQSAAVCDETGELLLRELYCFEGGLDLILRDIRERLADETLPTALPHINRTQRAPWQDHYTAESARLAEKWFADDFALCERHYPGAWKRWAQT